MPFIGLSPLIRGGFWGQGDDDLIALRIQKSGGLGNELGVEDGVLRRQIFKIDIQAGVALYTHVLKDICEKAFLRIRAVQQGMA